MDVKPLLEDHRQQAADEKEPALLFTPHTAPRYYAAMMLLFRRLDYFERSDPLSALMDAWIENGAQWRALQERILATKKNDDEAFLHVKQIYEDKLKVGGMVDAAEK